MKDQKEMRGTVKFPRLLPGESFELRCREEELRWSQLVSELRQLTSEFGEAMMVNLACQLGRATMPKYFSGFCECICYGVNVCVPPHSYVEAPIPSVVVIGGGPLRGH